MNYGKHEKPPTFEEVEALMEQLVREGKFRRLSDGQYDFTPDGLREYMEMSRAKGVNPLRSVRKGQLP